VRISALLFLFCGCTLRCLGQAEETGIPPQPGIQQVPVAPVAAPEEDSGVASQTPGAEQDAEAAREKLLKAADELDMIESNSESTKVTLAGMKTDFAQAQATITQLQADNSALKQQLADLQAAFDKEQADRPRERRLLLDEVAQLVAKTGGASHSSEKRHVTDDDSATPASSTEVHVSDGESGTGESAVPAPTGDPDSPDHTNDHSAPDTTSLAPQPDAPPAPLPKPRKGYYHVVESGETLSMICAAYRDHGVKVTSAQVRKANGLTEDSVLKVGQKLFIPKPGT